MAKYVFLMAKWRIQRKFPFFVPPAADFGEMTDNKMLSPILSGVSAMRRTIKKIAKRRKKICKGFFAALF